MSNPYKSVPVRSYEITPKETYLSRRDFIKAAGVVAGSAALAACAPAEEESSAASAQTFPALSDELGNPANAYEEITSYNNYYEFSTNKEAVAPL
ncbi:MAG: twin-arginine translocation signal domain-containing protein, partial [Chloroflexi bacterium]|nr:twin-arginine translocation signal domain-containing protein [Chloroflexota bacterium]